MQELSQFHGSLKTTGLNLDHGLWGHVDYSNIAVNMEEEYNRILFESYANSFCNRLNLKRRSVKIKVCQKLTVKGGNFKLGGLCCQKDNQKICRVFIRYTSKFESMIWTLAHELTHAYFSLNNCKPCNINYEEALCENTAFFLVSTDVFGKTIKTSATEQFIVKYSHYCSKRKEMLQLLPHIEDTNFTETAYELLPYELFHKIVSFEDAQFPCMMEACKHINIFGLRN